MIFSAFISESVSAEIEIKVYRKPPTFDIKCPLVASTGETFNCEITLNHSLSPDLKGLRKMTYDNGEEFEYIDYIPGNTDQYL